MAAVLLAGTALGGLAFGHAGFAAPESTPGTAVNPPGSGMTGHTLPDFTDLVTQVKPAVVSITTKLEASPASDEDQPQMPMPFRGSPFGGMGPTIACRIIATARRMGLKSIALHTPSDRGARFTRLADETVETQVAWSS